MHSTAAKSTLFSPGNPPTTRRVRRFVRESWEQGLVDDRGCPDYRRRAWEDAKSRQRDRQWVPARGGVLQRVPQHGGGCVVGIHRERDVRRIAEIVPVAVDAGGGQPPPHRRDAGRGRGIEPQGDGERHNATIGAAARTLQNCRPGNRSAGLDRAEIPVRESWGRRIRTRASALPVMVKVRVGWLGTGQIDAYDRAGSSDRSGTQHARRG